MPREMLGGSWIRPYWNSSGPRGKPGEYGGDAESIRVPEKCFFVSSRRRHTIFDCDWSSDVCSSDLATVPASRHRGRQHPRSAHSERKGRDRSRRFADVPHTRGAPSTSGQCWRLHAAASSGAAPRLCGGDRIHLAGGHRCPTAGFRSSTHVEYAVEADSPGVLAKVSAGGLPNKRLKLAARVD